MPEDGHGVPMENAEAVQKASTTATDTAGSTTDTKNIMEMPADQMQHLRFRVQRHSRTPFRRNRYSKELTYEERIQKAMSMPCPIKKYAGKTLGDLVVTDPKALNWIVNKSMMTRER